MATNCPSSRTEQQCLWTKFEEAKKNMEKALQEYISYLLRDRGAKIAA